MVRRVTPEIRHIREEELPGFIDSMSTGFLARPDVEKVAEDVKTLWDLNRTWAAFDVGRIVGTFRTWATELTVPGGAQVPGASVTNVTVLPTHRRRGVLRALVAAEHAAIRERGEAVALLYASEWPIYGRFGYGSACLDSTWTLEARATGFHGDPSGTVELVRPSAESRDLIKGVYDAWRLQRPGEIRRRDMSWEFDLGLRDSAWDPRWKGFLALHRDDSGTVDGYARYRADDKWENRQPHNTLTLDELHALNDDAYTGLWRFLAEVDWVATVKAERRSPSERLRWCVTNARAAVLSEVGDGMWVRLFDVARALEARSYEREGRVILEVIDAEAPGGRIRVQLDTTAAGATAGATKKSPDLTLDVSALGAAYLGGTSLTRAVIAKGADEHRDGALAEADALLRTLDEPWCSTFF
jgi:predicted acetyltransferase